MKYTVMSGDTMYKIAAQHGVSLDELLKANPGIVNPDLIFPGQVIEIPSPSIPGGISPELPPEIPPGEPPAISPPGGMMPGMPPGGMMPGMPPCGMMPGMPPGGMMPGILSGGMMLGMGFSLKAGDKGQEVKYLQKRLKELGYYNGNISGHFGPKTKHAVKKFQKDCQVAANGIADQFLLQTLG